MFASILVVAAIGFVWQPFAPVSLTQVSPAPTRISPTPTALTRDAPAEERATSTPQPTATAAPTATETPAAVAALGPDGLAPNGLRPNELGRIMILEYHQFGPTEDRWTRSFANFRQDLERLYRGDYRPIGLNEYIENRIDVPAGTTPIIFTFDDSSPAQFRYLPGPDGQAIVDPDSALGILLEFNGRHPDFRLRGSFFVLPGVDEVNRLFGQPQYAERKLRHLVSLGFELGNHTYWHMPLSKLDRSGVNKQLSFAVKAIQSAVPGYRVNSLALPLGAHAKETAWEARGAYDGVEYQNRAVLEVSGGGAYSPSHSRANPLALPRIQATPMELDFYEVYLDYYDRHRDERYVSDGDADRLVFPIELASHYRPAATDRPLPDLAPGLRAVALR